VENDTMSVIKAEFVDLRDVHPFVKWPGGKGQLLSELNRTIPRQFDSYYEPFLGGGAMFFHLMSRGIRFRSAYLSDTNTELITAYRAVKDNVKDVVRLLHRYETEYKRYRPYCKEQQEYYFQLRNARNKMQSGSDVEIAARLIVLNKTCFNGLYRVNGHIILQHQNRCPFCEYSDDYSSYSDKVKHLHPHKKNFVIEPYRYT
jgi:DNA adenine methylase